MANYFKRRLRMEKCARLEAQGIPDKMIAQLLRLSKAGLAQMKRDPSYPGIRITLATGVLGELDRDLAENRTYLKAALKQMVPAALQSLADLVLDRKNPRIRLEAAKQILNRDGLLAEVSKSQITVEDMRPGGNKVDDETADALIAAFNSVKKPEDSMPAPITDAVQ